LFAARLHAATPVTLCELAAHPADYDGKVIEVTAYASHGFENFTLFDPQCPEASYKVWLEYGGARGSGTIYCCGDTSDAKPRNTTIVEDAQLAKFDRILQTEDDTLIHATLRGPFFNGGYGHFGLYPMLVIEQVVDVETHDRRDVDYRASADPPDVDCSRMLELRGDPIALQKEAEAGARAWAFRDPMRVAREAAGGKRLRKVRQSRGRIVYEGWRVFVVVSRPAWIASFAADRHRIAWVAIAAYETGCK
jgi:hypothetical protein